uniref:Uncharacterized protein n=1 Tax=Rhizophora mucronata TaxID=61149 RepID=A0A2P2MKB9_RHIMU
MLRISSIPSSKISLSSSFLLQISVAILLITLSSSSFSSLAFWLHISSKAGSSMHGAQQ